MLKAGARVLTLDQLEGLKDPSLPCWTSEVDCDGDPPRLWSPAGMYPGTAFTRSIGDSGEPWPGGGPVCSRSMLLQASAPLPSSPSVQLLLQAQRS